MADIPTFETERLIIRPVIEADLPSFQKNFNHYEVIRHLVATVPWPYPEDGVRTRWEGLQPKLGKTHWQWGIFLKTQPQELIGAIDLWREGSPENRGFWITPAHQRKGLMSEAIISINDFAFNDLRFEKLIFNNAVGNTASRRIKEKTGARFVRREPCSFVDPNVTEHEIWELRAEDWRTFKASSGVQQNGHQSPGVQQNRPKL
mgnify:CR=1 FL=1